MGRFPFMTVANDYMELMRSVLAATTWKEYERRYRRMHEDLQGLKAAGKLSTTNPKALTEADILAYVACLRARGMKDTGVGHNIDVLTALTRFCGNPVVDRAKVRFPQHFPRFAKPKHDPIPDGDRATIIEAADRVPDADWRSMVAFGVAVTGICTGLRPKELRLAKIGDLDLRKGILHTDEVKGKGRYGEPRDSAIHPDGLLFIRRYVRARAKAVTAKAPTNDALFPAFNHRNGDGHFSPNGITDLRQIVKEATDVDFDMRACRRTFGQTAIDAGVPLDAVARMMGHASSKTTEAYYCRKTNDKAIEDAQTVWGSQPNPPERPRKPTADNSPLIEKGKYMSGYA